MRVICKFNEGRMVLSKCPYWVTATAHELKIGTVYTVYGQSVFNNCIEYLIDPQDNPSRRAPNWYPWNWFELVSGSIPISWLYSSTANPEPHVPDAIWGYPELALNPQHAVDLIERETEALTIFRERAGEIDREEGATIAVE